MATLAGQRAQFTWALNQYNLAEDSEEKAHFAKRMARYIKAAKPNGFTVDQVTQGQDYPAEVQKYRDAPGNEPETDISEEQAVKELEQALDQSDVERYGEGAEFVYAYGYRCVPDRLKIGRTVVEPVVQRIATQIRESTPARPILLVELRTHDCKSLESAFHKIFEHRGCKVIGGGKEWFKATREEVIDIYKFIIKTN